MVPTKVYRADYSGCAVPENVESLVMKHEDILDLQVINYKMNDELCSLHFQLDEVNTHLWRTKSATRTLTLGQIPPSLLPVRVHTVARPFAYFHFLLLCCFPLLHFSSSALKEHNWLMAPPMVFPSYPLNHVVLPYPTLLI